jgi:hypothetical protein
MAHLAQAANADESMRDTCVNTILHALRITKPCDQVAFCFELGKLRGGTAGGVGE